MIHLLGTTGSVKQNSLFKCGICLILSIFPFSSPLFRPPSLSRQKWKINSTTKWGEDERAKRRGGGESARARNENIVGGEMGESLTSKIVLRRRRRAGEEAAFPPNCPPQFPHPAITPYVDRRGGRQKSFEISFSLLGGVECGGQWRELSLLLLSRGSAGLLPPPWA